MLWRMDGLSWSDLELLLIVAREGTLTGAAKRLGVEQSTISRRLAALEQRAGSPLFARSKVGVHATPLALRLLPLAQRMEAAAHEASALAASRGDEPEGLVRVALPEVLADAVVAPALPELLAPYPRLRVELIASVALMDLSRLEADLALRFVRPAGGELVARRVGVTRMGVFGHVDYVDRWRRHGEPSLERLEWVGWSSQLGWLPEARWLESAVGRAPRVACTRATTILSAVLSGAGVALLPERFARRVKGLEEVALGLALPQVEVWLVKPSVHRSEPSVEVVAAWLSRLIQDMADPAP